MLQGAKNKMKQFLKLIAFVLVLILGWYVIRGVYHIYPTWALILYLSLFIFLPLLSVAGSIGNGLEGYKVSVRTMALSAVGLVITTILYKYITQNWWWACIAGALLPGILMVILQSQVTSASLTVNQAATLLNNGKYDDALNQIAPARKVLASRGNREGMALADFHTGIAYSKKGDTLRAVRYFNSALSLYRALGNADMTQKTQVFLAELAKQGVDTTMPAANDEEKAPLLEPGFMLSSLFFTASMAALVYFWSAGSWKVSWPILVTSVLFVLVFLAGNYVISAKGLWQEGGSHNGWSRFFFDVFFLILIPASAAWAMRLEYIHPAFFPNGMGGIVAFLTKFTASIPVAALWAILIVIVIILFATVLPSNPFQNILGGIGRIGAVEAQALARAKHYFDQREWSRAIPQLSQIDLTRDRDTNSKIQVLFALAFAHYMSDHKSESLQYLQELLEIDPHYSAALYLAGYIALKENQSDTAEGYWRTLVQHDRNYAPEGQRGMDAGAQYYLGLCLYRKALETMASNVDESANLLSEVGQMGSLDRHVADALVRVHLYRFVVLLRQRQWQDAGAELTLAQEKLKHLEGLLDNQEELTKLRGLCEAAQALLAYRQENYRSAAELFDTTRTIVKDISVTIPGLTGGKSLFEELLRSAMERSRETGSLHKNFNRDLAFLTGLGYLHALADSQEHSKKTDLKNTVALLEKHFEESISLAPEFLEGRAMLGIVYYYFSEDPTMRARGIEMLQSVRERVGSHFVTQTLTEHESDKKHRADAQQAYFELLQQYLQFSNVPLKQRQSLREKFLEKMKQTGKYDEFVGRGGLEIDNERERQPSVQEYLMRSELLQEKIRQLCELNRNGKLPAGVQKKIDDMGLKKKALQDNVDAIAKLERELLKDAQEYL